MSKAYMPIMKLHFQEPKSPKSGTWHNFQEGTSANVSLHLWPVPDFMENSQGNPTLCTALTDSTRNEYAVCRSHSPVRQSNHFTTVLPTSEFTQESSFLSTVTKCHSSWYSFLITWMLRWCGMCAISRLTHAFPFTQNVFANGALVPKLHSACSFADVMFSLGNFWETFSASCLLCKRRALPWTNLHISVSCACATCPQRAPVSSSTKALPTLFHSSWWRRYLISTKWFFWEQSERLSLLLFFVLFFL